MATPTVDSARPRLVVPDSFAQVTKLARYQLREYLRGRRLIALIVIVAAIGAILTGVVAHYRGSLISDNLSFYGMFWGAGVTVVIVLAAIFFGGDAIAGEFQNKTGYFLMGLPLKRPTIYVGKFIAAFLASVAIMLLFLVVLLLNGIYYFGAGAFPWQLFVSLVLAIGYLAAVLGVTFLFSSLFKTSAYGFVLTAILFLFGFTLIQDLVVGLVKIEPWMVISYADGVIGSVLSTNVNWGLTATVTTTTVPGPRGEMMTTTTYTAGIAEGIVIMLGYFVLAAVGGLLLFRREEFN